MSRPRRIGLIMQGGSGWVGGSEYIGNLIAAWATLPAETRARFELCLISKQPLDPAFAARLDPHLACRYALSEVLAAPTFARQARWFIDRTVLGRANSRFARFIAAERFDLLYPLTYDNRSNLGVTLPIAHELTCRWVGWIPDFQHRYLPELFSERELASRKTGIETLCREAPAIVFSSQCAVDDYRKFHPDAAARPELLHFCTSAPAAWFEGNPAAVQAQFHLPERFVLVSNQFWQHKNHLVVFDAIAALKARGIVVNVVCTGQTSDNRNRDYINTVLRRIHELGIAPQVFLLGLIERAEQIQLMRRSLAVVQPSLFEGWSTVLEDARALGKTIFASDIGVHREQDVPGARFFDPASAESLADNLAAAWPTLEPGPDLPREREARERLEQAVPAYGRRFLEIVEAALR